MKSKTKGLFSKALILAVLFISAFVLSACGHEHNFQATYTYNSTHHWQECTDENCDEVQNYEEHNFVNEVCTVCYYGATVTTNVGTTTKYFKNFAQALASITDNTQTTITLLQNVTEGGVQINENKNITIDLNNHTYTLVPPMVGSSGTTTIGFQLYKNSNIVIKNGTIKHSTVYTQAQDDQDCKILIQNYCNLTLENVTLDARSSDNVCLYALSNNFGSVLLKGNTNIMAANGKVAFDLWYGMASVYYNGVTVTFDQTYTGTVTGKVEYGAQSEQAGWQDKTQLTIMSGTFNFGEIRNLNSTNMNIVISGGNFDIDVSAYCADGFKVEQSGERYVVVAE